MGKKVARVQFNHQTHNKFLPKFSKIVLPTSPVDCNHYNNLSSCQFEPPSRPIFIIFQWEYRAENEILINGAPKKQSSRVFRRHALHGTHWLLLSSFSKINYLYSCFLLLLFFFFKFIIDQQLLLLHIVLLVFFLIVILLNAISICVPSLQLPSYTNKVYDALLVINIHTSRIPTFLLAWCVY